MNAAGTAVGYNYDPIGQLKVATSTTSSENRGYLYDAAWNLNMLTNNGTATTFGVDGKNQLTTVGSSGFIYDANGNLTIPSSSTTYGYDGENRLVSVTVAGSSQTTFVYDGLGRLRKQSFWTWTTGGGGESASVRPGGVSPASSGGGGGGGGGSWTFSSWIEYIYDGNRVIQERDSNNNPTVSYTRGNDMSGTLQGAGGIGGLLARSSGYSSGNFSTHNYYHADGNGNITYLETSAQGLAASYRYDPFGNTTASSGSYATANTYRFSSKEWIPAVSGYYYLYRFYVPSFERWLNQDPIEEDGGVNLYGFVDNDSIDDFDINGQAPHRKGARNSTRDQHQAPRSGRPNTKNRQKPGWTDSYTGKKVPPPCPNKSTPAPPLIPVWFWEGLETTGEEIGVIAVESL